MAWERVGGEWCVRGRWVFSVRVEIEFGGVVLAQLRWCALCVRVVEDVVLGETGGRWQGTISSGGGSGAEFGAQSLSVLSSTAENNAPMSRTPTDADI